MTFLYYKINSAQNLMPRKRKKQKPLKKVIVNPGRREDWHGFYKIEVCAHKQFTQFLYCDFRYSVIYKHYLQFIEESNKVILPVRYTKTRGGDYKLARYEILVIQRTDTDETTTLTNEFGDKVELTAFNVARNGTKYKIIHKAPYNIEERFQLFGSSEKKTVLELYSILFEEHLPRKLSHCHINIYKNKLVFTYNPGDIEVVTTKNKSEAIRLYNKLKELVETNKNPHRHYIAFVGYCPGALKSKIIDAIQLRTGWTRVRICRAKL